MKIRIEFGAARSACDCEQCDCHIVPGYLIPADLTRLIPPDTDPFQWAEEHLLASPGATVIQGGIIRRIPTLVPARAAHGGCHFLSESRRCTVHANAPFGCAFFGCQSGREADALSAKGLEAIEFDRENTGLYTQLWHHLDGCGLLAIPPEVARRAIA